MLRGVADDNDYEVRFDAPRVGLTLDLHEMDRRICVTGVTGPALADSPPIHSGDVLLAINGAAVSGLPETVAAIKIAPRPLVLRLRRRVPCLELPPNFALQRTEGRDDDSQCAVVSTASSDDLSSSAKTASSRSLRGSSRLRRLEWFRSAAPWEAPAAAWLPHARQVAVSWTGAPGHRLYVSRDWPVKVWRLCPAAPVASGEQVVVGVSGLEPGKSYVFRLRASHGAPWQQ
ncbi:hypothetical protein ACHHYP_05056 [Achlya hypogyna]|uniref:PDZ domain-containing protein n=1 Tax=Achlya hypogyna TaxID=1202772 RepID=A0A1V9YZ30_ACHHY|nr:hypothetical protein ACHHYP_05056 [Achlya hypogyna]